MSRKNRTQPSPEPEQSSLSSSSHENAFHSYQTPQSSSLYPHHYPPTYAVYTGEQGTYGHDIQAYTSYPLDSTQFSPQDLSTDRPQNSGLPWQGHDAEPTPDLLLEHPGFYGLPYPSYPEGQPLVSPTSRPPSTPHHVPLPSSDPPRSHPVDPMHIQGDNFHGELHAQRSPSTTQFSPYPSTPSSVNTSSPTSDSSQLSSPAMQDPTMALALPNISNSRDQKVPRPTKSIERRVLGAKINKNSKGKKPRRKLTPEERDKADAMRYYGACWRCKRYKKPCNGPGVCNTCLTSGFRVWPSALGCRRGDLECFAFGVLPPNAEQTLKGMSFTYQRPPSWRTAPKTILSEMYIAPAAATGDKWEQTSFRVQCTGIHGPGILELLEIAANFQRAREKENKVVNLAMVTLSNSCDLYRICVETSNPLSFAALADTLTKTRKSLQATLNSFLTSCLTGRIKDWLPSFIATCMTIFSYIVLTDALYAIPANVRSLVWYDANGIIMDLRQQLYPMAQDLLSALGRGSKPLKQSCWEMEEVVNERGERRMERTVEGMKLVDEDQATYDGLRALQGWHRRYEAFVKDERWLASPPYTVDLLPITALSKIFDFSPRK